MTTGASGLATEEGRATFCGGCVETVARRLRRRDSQLIKVQRRKLGRYQIVGVGMVGFAPVWHHTPHTADAQLDDVGKIPGLVPDPLWPMQRANAGPHESRFYPKDEAPAAYKDFDAVLDSVKAAGLASEIARLKARFVIKDAEPVCEGQRDSGGNRPSPGY